MEETTTSTNSFGEEGPGRCPDEEEEQDDDDDDDEREAQVSRPPALTTTYKHLFYRISGERLPLEPAWRKSVDMWTSRRGKRIERPHACACRRACICLVGRLSGRVQSGDCHASLITLLLRWVSTSCSSHGRRRTGLLTYHSTMITPRLAVPPH